jgi:hypothetical protein
MSTNGIKIKEDVSLNLGNEKKLLKKNRIKEYNENKVNNSLDPNIYMWNSRCKKCGGRGFIGKYQENGKPEPILLLCKCAKQIKKPTVNQ